MKLPLRLVTALLTASATHAATLPASEDTYGFRAKLNLVANRAATLPVDATHRAFVWFNLADLPPGATLRYARLRLYRPRVVRAGGGLSVHQVTGTWDESLASGEPAFTATPLANLPASVLGTKRFISVDVTATVQGWLAAPASNEGFAIAAIPGATAKLTASVSLGAKEGAGSGYPAELDVEIADDPIAPGAVGNAQIATGAVQAENIASGAVGSIALADGSVTTPKLATAAVTDEKIVSISGGKVTGSVASALAAGNVSGFPASATPAANTLLPLDASGKYHGSIVQAGSISSSQLAPDLFLDGTTNGTFAGDGSGLTNVSTVIADGTVTFSKLETTLAAGLSSVLPQPLALQFVTVGDPGNLADTLIQNDGTSGYGSVAVAFAIGKYEVSNEQYVEFLNAVAKIDPNGLYNPLMASDSGGGIVRDGAPGEYFYTAKVGMRRKPVVFVSWFDAIRFSNWLHNGKPSGPQDATTTEDGAYVLAAGGAAGPRKAGASYFLPTENEWYKAAYHDPSKPSGSKFWLYATKSNAVPAASGENVTIPNSANYYDQGPLNPTLTPIGGFTVAVSYYDTHDQSGNCDEWTETANAELRVNRGGAFAYPESRMRSSVRAGYQPDVENAWTGFRVAKK
jgi:formylglycine-generating enzyme